MVIGVKVYFSLTRYYARATVAVGDPEEVIFCVGAVGEEGEVGHVLGEGGECLH